MNGSFLHPSLSRRTALQAGTLGLLGLGLHHLAPLRALADPARREPSPRARAVIYIFLSGGLAQHDSFDPKPDAPDGIRGEFAPIATRTPGVHICEHLPRLAERSSLWALCRSLTHGTNAHSAAHHMMLTGRSTLPAGFDPSKPKASDHPSLAALATHLLPPRNNLPPAIVLPETLVHREGRVLPGQFAGELGPRWDPYVLGASPYNPTSYGAYPQFGFHHERGAENPARLAFQVPSLTLPEGLDRDRLGGRVDLLKRVEDQQRRLDRQGEVGAFDRHRQEALALLTDPKVRQAFDVHNADARTQERYGRNVFGWSLLLARRLVEAGVALVQVNLGNNETWDTHQAAFPNLKNFLLPPTDRAVSALLDDLNESGLLESTLVVLASEFGRTPRIFTLAGSRLPGRDHWGAVQTLLFAGGGVHGGAVVGASDRNGAYPHHDPQTPEDFAATIFAALGIPESTAWHDPADRPHYLYQGKPIQGLF